MKLGRIDRTVPTEKVANGGRYAATRVFAEVEEADVAELVKAINATLAAARKNGGTVPESHTTFSAEHVLSDVTAKEVAAAIKAGLSLRYGDNVMALAYSKALAAKALTPEGVLTAPKYGTKVSDAELDAARKAMPATAKAAKTGAVKGADI